MIVEPQQGANVDDRRAEADEEPFLAGLRVLDLSRVLAGPLAGQVLADLGAEVLKVEPPAGDDTRSWGPPFQGEMAAYFASCNRGKVSLVLDLGTATGRSRLGRLLAAADVVLHNCLPATASRLGLSAERLRAAHPGLVALGITGYSGTRRAEPGYDLALQAETGWIGVTGPEESGYRVGVAVVDVLTGMMAANGVQAALLRRARTGRGAVLSLSLYRTGLFSLVNVATNHLVSGAPTRRWGNRHPNLVPYQSFPAADRELVLGVGNDGQFGRLCDLLGIADPALRRLDNKRRLAHRSAVVDAVATAVARWPAADLVDRLRAAGIPAGLLQMPEEALAEVPRWDPEALLAIAHPRVGTVRMVAPPLESGGMRRDHLPPPLLGEGGEDLAARWEAAPLARS
jgi:crotonobetainyl-CoA:carnitine CoA-transferase CaiB-like acyl-CoA transferase